MFLLAKSKLNSEGNIISKALIDTEFSHEEISVITN